jgi:hypothetical protein
MHAVASAARTGFVLTGKPEITVDDLSGVSRPTASPLTQMVQTLFDSVENARLVEYKLHRLEHHLTISGRMLNDLRRLRGLLLDESLAAA